MAQATIAPETHGTGHDIPHGHGPAEHPTSSGINSRKLFMWIFLASDCMFFGSLIATYMIYRDKELTGPTPHQLIDIPATSISTFVLLTSSLAMLLALAGLQRGDIRASRVWLATTGLLGLIFLGGQFFEFTDFYREGLTPQVNIFGATFFTLTGIHGTHVAIGVVWIFTLFFVSLRGGLKKEDSLDLELAGLYWHFVDLVWVVIFTLVYLIPYDNKATAAESARQVFETGKYLVAGIL
jgi:heme/copper-type cytochrome/quinol oxidase subunit 3